MNETDAAELRARLDRAEAREVELCRLLVEAYEELERRSRRNSVAARVWSFRVAVAARLPWLARLYRGVRHRVQ